MIGHLTALATALGPEWSWLDDARTGTLVILHGTGLHIRCAPSMVYDIDSPLAKALAGRLRLALTEGVTGEVSATIHRNDHGDGDVTYRVSLSRGR